MSKDTGLENRYTVYKNTNPDKSYLFICVAGEDYGLVLNKKLVHNPISILQSFVHHDNIGTYGYLDKEVGHD